MTYEDKLENLRKEWLLVVDKDSRELIKKRAKLIQIAIEKRDQRELSLIESGAPGEN